MSTTVKTFNHSSKTHALSEHLAAMAVRLGPEAKMPTIQELRRELNVSISTLDNALTQLESQKIIYRKHGVGIFVSPHVGTKSIALVCDPGFFRAGMSPFWQEIIEGVRTYGAERGETCRFYLALPSGQGPCPVPDNFVEDVRNKRIDGVLFVGYNIPASEWILEEGVPMVSFAGSSPCMVEINYRQIITKGLRALHANGATEVGLIFPFLPEPTGEYVIAHKGVETFEAEISELGMTTKPDWIWDFHRNPKHRLATTHQEQGYNAIFELYGSEGGISAGPKSLVSMDDMMTRGALVAMQKLGVRLGQDVQISTHTNRGSSVLQGYESDLICVEVDPSAIVTAMFALLETVLEGKDTSSQRVLIDAHLV